MIHMLSAWNTALAAFIAILALFCARLRDVQSLLGRGDCRSRGRVDSSEHTLSSGYCDRRARLCRVQCSLGCPDARLVRKVAGAGDDSLRGLEHSVRRALCHIEATQLRAETSDGSVARIVPRQAVVVVDLTLDAVDLALQAVDLVLRALDCTDSVT